MKHYFYGLIKSYPLLMKFQRLKDCKKSFTRHYLFGLISKGSLYVNFLCLTNKGEYFYET